MAAGKKTIFFQFVSILKRNSEFKTFGGSKAYHTAIFTPFCSIKTHLPMPEKNTFVLTRSHILFIKFKHRKNGPEFDQKSKVYEDHLF